LVIIKKLYYDARPTKYQGTHKLLVYTDNVNILAGNRHTLKKNTDSLVVTSA